MKINRNFCVREIAGDFILVPVGEAALEFSGIITTNEVGALIWETLQQDVTMEQLVQKITDEFENNSFSFTKSELQEGFDLSDFSSVLASFNVHNELNPRVWNNGIIAKYNGEKKPVRAMRPYLDEVYTPEVAKAIIELFDTRSYSYRNLITFKQFQQDIELLKPRKSG